MLDLNTLQTSKINKYGRKYIATFPSYSNKKFNQGIERLFKKAIQNTRSGKFFICKKTLCRFFDDYILSIKGWVDANGASVRCTNWQKVIPSDLKYEFVKKLDLGLESQLKRMRLEWKKMKWFWGYASPYNQIRDEVSSIDLAFNDIQKRDRGIQEAVDAMTRISPMVSSIDLGLDIAILNHLRDDPQMDADGRRTVETRRSAARIVQVI